MARSIEQAAREWVEAEYAFRLGPGAYSTETQDHLVRAENRLRRAVAGVKGLAEAKREIEQWRKENP